MMEQSQVFHLPEFRQRERILVIGVGGGGGNALNHIIDSGIEGIEFLAANTDSRALDMNKAPHKIILGEKLTKGLGAGANPQVGMDAAKESLDRIREYMEGSDMVFITAGMGGGTGTGAAPIIAEAAREMNILVVGVVTTPFSFEMKRRSDVAKEGVIKLKEKVDALLVVENARLEAMADDKLKTADAYKMANEVLRQAVQGVTDLILHPGEINVDFADVKAIMKNAGAAIMGIGSDDGENRAENAARFAVRSPLMSVSPKGAKGILVNIATGPDVTILEMKKAINVITESADQDAQVIWGHSTNESFGNMIRITVIATGFITEEDYPQFQNVEPRQPKEAPLPPSPAQAPARSRGLTLTTYIGTSKDKKEKFQNEDSLPPGDEDMFSGAPKSDYDEPAIYRKEQKSGRR